MKSFTTQLALSLTLVLGSLSNAFAADIDYPQTGPVFTDSAYLVGGIGEVDTFYFTVAVAGNYHFYATATDIDDVDTRGFLYSDSYSTMLATNDDGGPSWGFCVESYLYAGEAITLLVDGYFSSSEGNYNVTGAAGTCADSALYFSEAGWDLTDVGATSTTTTITTESDSGAFGLPALLFTILGLGAVRLRRFFA